MRWTIHSAAAAIREGRLTPLELLDTCLEQIDRREDRVRAWVFVDWDRARRQAEQAAAELRAGRWRGPLHGIPLGIKDIFDVFDWPTAAGSKLWAQSIARHDATAVQRLRQAGAVFLGKTVTTAYASFDPPPTRNPWNLEHTPGGSSSGSAAAVACGMCLGALGSQTGGSITRPAAFCGVPGFKPTYGRVSVVGVVPLAPSMDHVGPMAGCVRDLAILLQAIAGPDCRDPECIERAVPDLTARLRGGVTPPRVGRVRGLFEDLADPAVRNMMEEVSARLRTQKAVITDVALPGSFAECLIRHQIVMAVESAAYHQERLQRHPEDYPPRIRSLIEEGLACSATEYARTKIHQKQLTHDMLGCFGDLDALLMPAAVGPAPKADTTGNPAFNSPWSYTGLPTVSMPAARSAEGLPLAIQVVGRPWSEADLLATAAWCEQVLGLGVLQPPNS
jgi:aspartyl-tRNA(Asn)/glutamyl-tRNA(Gln) amidotransferase subunit A